MAVGSPPIRCPGLMISFLILFTLKLLTSGSLFLSTKRNYDGVDNGLDSASRFPWARFLTPAHSLLTLVLLRFTNLVATNS